MPVITVALNPTSEEKKRQLVEVLTREAARITGIAGEHFMVFVQEHPHENIGVGGRILKEILEHRPA